jgi:hypothetical protein
MLEPALHQMFHGPSGILYKYPKGNVNLTQLGYYLLPLRRFPMQGRVST